MRIAFFNWRDISHPLAGGAEVYVHQLMKRLAERGHTVALFTSTFPGAKERETIDGIEHIRYGGRFMIYPKAFFCYKKHIEGRYDAVVESINGAPFLTKLFAKEPVVPLIHQLTKENWHSGLPLPLAFIGYHLEDAMLSIYRGCKTIAPSKSTKSDLERLGFPDVEIVYGASGIEAPDAGDETASEIEKEKAPTLIYLGRLVKSKRVDHALRAFAIIRSTIPNCRLWIVGSGPEEKNLKKLSSELGLYGKAYFFGRVSEQDKIQLLSKAHIMLLPAVREGWGLVVLEANACRTPVIGYDVPGLRDSIKDSENGYLVEDGDINALASRASTLLPDRLALDHLGQSSAHYSKKFSWDKTADGFLSILREVLR